VVVLADSVMVFRYMAPFHVQKYQEQTGLINNLQKLG
jgi:hypothetical protein